MDVGVLRGKKDGCIKTCSTLPTQVFVGFDLACGMDRSAQELNLGLRDRSLHRVLDERKGRSSSSFVRTSSALDHMAFLAFFVLLCSLPNSGNLMH